MEGSLTSLMAWRNESSKMAKKALCRSETHPKNKPELEGTGGVGELGLDERKSGLVLFLELSSGNHTLIAAAAIFFWGLEGVNVVAEMGG